ncbi:helix-turn-helix domain-containing protein [Comamonas sp. NLF-1-9]|uniref:helix-turn-helix domain-containing protein n=1 Tax=Comamonas sp. NLF-1-9 TaxID=2853163 RepID=UPI001C450D52|nr:helix-turn-helix domain-containing protein [Comamonas sp. NLF-1-9]QXL83153.1 helix-turn-helix domain-containing protein [Comamonas sp. NLF-1-9]
MKKRPTRETTKPSAIPEPNSAIVTDTTPKGNCLRLSPRQARVLYALELRANQLMPWLWREEVDRVAKASNGPDVVFRLRGKLGDDAIDTQIVEAVDSDGKPSRPGRYRLTGIGLARLAKSDWRPA